MKTGFLVVLLGIAIAGSVIFAATFQVPIGDSQISFESPFKDEHYEIQITGMKKTYHVGEQYDFSYVLSGYGDPCGGKSVNFPDQDGVIQTMGTSASCAAEVSLRDFVWDIQKERGTTYGHVKLKYPGTYNVTVSFEKLKEPAVFEFEVIPKEACSIQCLVYDPVCGKDGVTYGCGVEDAACHGIEVDYKGECNIPSTSSYIEEIIPTLDDFKNVLSEPYDINDIFSKFGEPHDDIGSGIHIYVYELNDSTEIWIGYADDVLYLKHVDADGNELEDLFVKKTEPKTTLKDDFDIAEVNLFLEKYPQAKILVDQIEYKIHKKHYVYADIQTKDSVNLVLTKHVATENMNSILSCHLDQYQNKTYGIMGSEEIIEYLQNHDCLSDDNIGKLEPITMRENFLELGFGEDAITVFITNMANHSAVSTDLFITSQEWAIIPTSNLVEAHDRLPETSSDDRMMGGTIVSETVKAGTYLTQNGDKEFWYTIRGSEYQIITIELQDHEFDRIIFVSENSKKLIKQINDVAISGENEP